MPPKGENPYTRCAESVSCINWRVHPAAFKKEGRTTQILLRINLQVPLRHISMKKIAIKKGATVAFAGVMATGMAVIPAVLSTNGAGGVFTPAYAFGPEGSDTITLNGSTKGHTYEAYQLFTADFSGDSISNIQFGSGVNGSELLKDAKLKALIEKNSAGYTAGDGTSKDALVSAASLARWLNKQAGYTEINKDSAGADDAGNSKADVMIQFNQIVAKHLVESESLTAKTGEGTTAEFNIPSKGYYFIKDADAGDSYKPDASTEFIVRTVNGDTQIAVKQSVPTLDKQVQEDSDKSWGKNATNAVGDTVNYKLTTTVPTNLAKFKTYTYKIHDKLDKGLTFDKNSVTAVDGGKDLSNYFTLEETPEANDTLTISFDLLAALKDGAIAPGDTIVTTYSGTLNKDAVVAPDGSNTNSAALQYSNNPNTKYDGASESTTTTPPSKTHDYTIKARIIKQTSDEKTLAGAKFRLLNSDKTKAAVIADGKIQSWVDKDAVDKGTVFTTGDNGVFAFAGIDVDENYYLEETEAPKDYSKLGDPVLIHINRNDAINYANAGATFDNTKLTGTVNYKKPGDLEKSNTGMTFNADFNGLEAPVLNDTGILGLPSTGGMGTVMLYVAGGSLILAAGYALYRRKKVSDAE